MSGKRHGRRIRLAMAAGNLRILSRQCVPVGLILLPRLPAHVIGRDSVARFPRNGSRGNIRSFYGSDNSCVARFLLRGNRENPSPLPAAVTKDVARLPRSGSRENPLPGERLLLFAPSPLGERPTENNGERGQLLPHRINPTSIPRTILLVSLMMFPETLQKKKAEACASAFFWTRHSMSQPFERCFPINSSSLMNVFWS